MAIPVFISRVLNKHGLKLEDLESWPTEKMLSLPGLSEKSVHWLLDYFDRDNDIPVEPDEVLGVPLRTVKGLRNLRGTWNAFGADTKQEFDALNIPDEQLAQMVSGGGEPPKPHREIREEVETLYQQYRAAYSPETPNDDETLRNLAFMNVRARVIREDLTALTKTAIDTKRAGMLQSQLVSLSGEARRLEIQVGIDRPSREKGFNDPWEVIGSGIRDAGDVLKEEVHEVVHACADGIDSPPIMALWHYFPTEPHEPFFQKCPRCGERFKVEYRPRSIPVEGRNFVVAGMETIEW